MMLLKMHHKAFGRRSGSVQIRCAAHSITETPAGFKGVTPEWQQGKEGQGAHHFYSPS